MTTKYDNLIRATLSRNGVAIDTGHHAFDLLDEKGRGIGFRWAIYPCTVTAVGDAPVGCYLVDPAMPGERFRIFSSVTRGDKNYGPAQGYNDIHADLETARREVVRRAEAARKRYARKFKQGPALLTEILNGRG